MTVKYAVESKDIVSGLIPVNSIDAYVLFDLGATCSFISQEFVQHLNLPFEQLDYPLNVEVANKEVIPVEHIHRNCSVEIGRYQFLVDLISIQLGEFDVILGMDWLNNHEALIDYHRKFVNLQTPNQSNVVFYGNQSPRQSRCLSMMQAKRLLRKGCVGYLAYTIDT